VRRALRRLRRGLRPRNLVTALVLLVSLLVVAIALTGPERRPTPYRTDPVRKALGLPMEETVKLAETQSPVPSLSASPRFVLPDTVEPERWVLTALPALPAEPQPPVVAAVEPPSAAPEPPRPPSPEPAPPEPTQAAPAPPASPPRVVARPQPPAPQLAAAVVLPLPPSRPRPPPRTGAPMLAIVIDDVGPAVALSRRTARLPRPVTLAFLPYAAGLDTLISTAKAHGHEIFLHLPMEPQGDEDPGPNAILTGLEPKELQRRLAWALERLPQATGVNNHMGSRASSDPAVMLAVLQEIRRRGLAFVDSRTSPLSVGASLAERLGLASAARDVFLDNQPNPAAIRRRLDEAERLARRRGQALAIGHPYPATLEVLETWLPQAEARGLRIVRAGDLIARRSCPEVEMPIPVSACAGADCPPPAPGC
jgi:polysaccharide deacetylase 2 family uncharacterized protein YibQ